MRSQPLNRDVRAGLVSAHPEAGLAPDWAPTGRCRYHKTTPAVPAA